MVGRHDDDVGVRERVVERGGGLAHVGIVGGDVGQLPLEQTDELVREGVALVVGSGLEGETEHRDLQA